MLGSLQAHGWGDCRRGRIVPVAQPLVWVSGAVGLFPGSIAGSQQARLGEVLSLALFPNCSLHAIMLF